MQKQTKKYLPKKVLIFVSLICLLISLCVPKKVDAASFADTNPANVDSTLGAVGGGAVGIVAVGAVIGSVYETGVGVLDDVYSASKYAVQELSAQKKQELFQSIDFAKNTVSWSAEQVNSLLDAMKPHIPPPAINIDTTMGVGVIDNTSFIYNANVLNGYNFKVNGTYNPTFKVSGSSLIFQNNKWVLYVSFNNEFYYSSLPYPGQAADALMNSINEAKNAKNLSALIPLLNQFEGLNVSMTKNGVDLQPYPNVISQIETKMRDKPLTLGLPTASAYAENGTKLKLLDGVVGGELGLTADGLTPYQDTIYWRHDYNEGMSLPAPYIYNPTGVPVLSLDGTLVTADGKVVPQADVGNLVTEYPTIGYEVINGEYVTTFTTATGTVINAITGAIISAVALEALPGGNVIPKKENNPIKPNKPTGRVGTMSQLLPLAVAAVFFDLLKAIAYYCVRLFNFLVSLPLTPSKRIDNETFTWFKSMTWLGVRIYDFVLMFGTLAASMSLFKFFRRYI